MITDINSEDRLVQKTFADHLDKVLGWDSVYAFNSEKLGPLGTLGRSSERDVVLVPDLRAAMIKLNPKIPEIAIEQAIDKITHSEISRSLLQHNRDFYGYIQQGVPVEWHDASGNVQWARARTIDFRDPSNNQFLVVRELKIQGVRVPHYNRRADLICFVNGLPLVFIECKAVYRNIRTGFDENITDYLNQSIAHAFHHNAFIIVTNGDAARYGSITSRWEHFVEWKRNHESEVGRVDAETLLNGMLDKERLLDIVENFILFDDSRAGGTRKIVARNQQVLGVNNAVASVLRQEELKREFPEEIRRVEYHIPEPELLKVAEPEPPYAEAVSEQDEPDDLPIVKRAHPDLGRLGVFWHTQGSGKSYSMLFFAEKVRRIIPGNFTFVVMTDREDLDDQIWHTAIGCGVVDENTPRATSGKELKLLLQGNHRYVFSLIHKFNQPVTERYSPRDDIIVISDEAHRTQAGKFARNMRRALPNAGFIGFTGTPLFTHDELTRRIFGDYVSRYDFKRSEQDNSTVKLIYEGRGEKLGVARLDLNARIAQAIEEAELDPEQTALLEKLLGRDYEVITADDRIDKIADDFVEHCSTRWETGKSMFVCIDKITCARMLQRIEPRWQSKIESLKALKKLREAEMDSITDPEAQQHLVEEVDKIHRQIRWMESTIIEIIISEGQNEVRDFKKWDFDIVPHRIRMKKGFDSPEGRVSVDDAFKDPEHPFRVAIVCAMWLAGFDVESLATLYIDKPMKSHNLMQAITRPNRVFGEKECGVIVDYNGLLRSLRKALSEYALGDVEAEGDREIVAPIEELVAALVASIETVEAHLLSLGFDCGNLVGADGFDRTQALRDAVNALYSSDEAKQRFEIMSRQMFARFKALLMEPSALQFAERHDNLEAIYKKLQERRDTADVTELLKTLHRIVNEAIRADTSRVETAEGITIDLSQIDFERLKEEFATKVRRKNLALEDMRVIVERKLTQMLVRNPTRMDYYRRYQEIVAEYNQEKDRATVEETFARLVSLAHQLDDEEKRTIAEGLTDDELALFDMLYREGITKADREKLKQSSKDLLSSLKDRLRQMYGWTKKASTQADVKVFIQDNLYQILPRPPFTDDETEAAAEEVYNYVWERAASGLGIEAA